MPTTVESDGIGRFSQDVEATVYFSVLEALQNVAKYAEASSATVRLSQTNGTLRFEVADDGRGFDPASTGYGTGLQGIADRLAAIGGSIEVRSTPGSATIAGLLSVEDVAGDRPQRRTDRLGPCGVTTLLVVAALVLKWFTPKSDLDVGLLVVIAPGLVAIAVVGALIASRSGNAVGWTLLAIATSLGLGSAASAYLDAAIDSNLPLVDWAYWLSQWTFLASLPTPIAVFFLFPTGTIASPRWRWVWRAYLVAIPVVAVGFMLLPQDSVSGGVRMRNPIHADAIQGPVGVVTAVAGLWLLICTLLSVLRSSFRYRGPREKSGSRSAGSPPSERSGASGSSSTSVCRSRSRTRTRSAPRSRTSSSSSPSACWRSGSRRRARSRSSDTTCTTSTSWCERRSSSPRWRSS